MSGKLDHYLLAAAPGFLILAIWVTAAPALAAGDGGQLADRIEALKRGGGECAAKVGADSESGASAKSVLFLKPGERVPITRSFTLYALPPNKNKSCKSLKFKWKVIASPGKAAPDNGENNLDWWGGAISYQGRDYVEQWKRFDFVYQAPGRAGEYKMEVQAILDRVDADACGIKPRCRTAQSSVTVVVGDAQYSVSINGQYVTDSGAKVGLSVTGEFDIDAKGKASGHATHANLIVGECVKYRDSMPQKIEGWVEGNRIHLRFNKAGEATPSTDEINKEDISCMFKGIKELGTMLAMVGGDVARQAGAPGTSTAKLPGGLEIPGEVTFPLIEPGAEHVQRIGNLRYVIGRRK